MVQPLVWVSCIAQGWWGVPLLLYVLMCITAINQHSQQGNASVHEMPNTVVQCNSATLAGLFVHKDVLEIQQ